MKVVLKFIFDNLTSKLCLPTSNLTESIIFSTIAFIVAYLFVRMLYKDGDLHTKTGGSIAHWTIRFAIFFALYGFLWLIVFIINHLLLLNIILATSCLVLVVMRFIMRLINNDDKKL